MRLFVDLDTLAISDYKNSAIVSARAKRSDSFPVEVKFTRDGVVQELPSGTVGRIVIKRNLDFSGFPIAWAPVWRKFGAQKSAYYILNLNLHTQQVVDQFLTLSGESASIVTALEIQWEYRGMRRTSQSIVFTIENDYVRLEDEQEVPTPIIIPNQAPVLTLIGSQQITIDMGSAFVDPGATLTDNYDPPKIVYSSNFLDTSVPGNYVIHYHAKDVAGNSALPITRNVKIRDTIPPVIELIRVGWDENLYVSVGNQFTDPGANVTDNVDSLRVIYGVGTVNTNIPGVYTLTYNAIDADGNAATQKTRSVYVEG